MAAEFRREMNKIILGKQAENVEKSEDNNFRLLERAVKADLKRNGSGETQNPEYFTLKEFI